MQKKQHFETKNGNAVFCCLNMSKKAKKARTKVAKNP